MVGKNPHRPEGKASDSEHMTAPHEAPSAKEIEDENIEQMDRHGGPSIVTEEHQVGGSRPGVPSRVKDAIAEREERDEA